MKLRPAHRDAPILTVLATAACFVVLALLTAVSTASAPAGVLSYADEAGPRRLQGTAAGGPTQDPPAEQKRQEHRVSGKVIDKDGNAVERAEVSFDGPKRQKVFTDERGQFSFTGPSGDYGVVVKAGERRAEFKVKIEGGELKPSTLVIDPEVLP